MRLLRKFQIREYNRNLYFRIVKESDRERLIESGLIYYNYLIKEMNQIIKNSDKDKSES